MNFDHNFELIYIWSKMSIKCWLRRLLISKRQELCSRIWILKYIYRNIYFFVKHLHWEMDFSLINNAFFHFSRAMLSERYFVLFMKNGLPVWLLNSSSVSSDLSSACKLRRNFGFLKRVLIFLLTQNQIKCVIYFLSPALAKRAGNTSIRLINDCASIIFLMSIYWMLSGRIKYIIEMDVVVIKLLAVAVSFAACARVSVFLF